MVSLAERLSHPTALRPRVSDRRPRSQIITPVSSFHSFAGIIRETITMSSYQKSVDLFFCLPQASLSSINLESSVEERREKDRAKDGPESSSRSVDTSLKKGVPNVSVRPLLLFYRPEEGARPQFHI